MEIHMKSPNLKFFRWQPSRETFLALLTAVLVVGFSAGMRIFETIPPVGIALRDAGQIFFAGILLPLWILRRFGISFADYGLSLRKWPIFLPINLALACLLLAMFISEVPIPMDFRIEVTTLWKAGYVLLALCFEVFFFPRLPADHPGARVRHPSGDRSDGGFLLPASHGFPAGV